MSNNFEKIAVLGAGVMGAQIAGHFANAGITALLFDINQELAQKGVDGLTKQKPAPLYKPKNAELVSACNYDDHVEKLKDVDLVIEAVAERLDIKHAVYNNIVPHLKESVILTSNTSGIPLEDLTKVLSDNLKKRFMITHFFNPPRYMHLLELVKGPNTDNSVYDEIARLGEDVLGKGIVHAKDTPNFIGNRIGVYGMAVTMNTAIEHGLTVEEVDKLTGTVVGRPKSATFRTADVVGLDTMINVSNTSYNNLDDDEERDQFKIPDFLQKLVDDGIEEDMVKSAVNSIDFKLRESNFGGFPKGIVYNIQTLASWLYDSDPFMHLKYDKLMGKIKRKSKERYFENLIGKYLLNNNHQSVMLAKPKPDLEKKKDAKVRKNMKTLKASMSQSDIENLVQKTQELQAMQIKPDTPEALEKLPSLDIKDIEVKSERFPMELKRKSEPKILFHDLFTNNIAYVQIGFDALSIPLDKVPYLSLVGNLVLGMGTRKHSYMEISQLLGIHTGGLRSWHFTSAEVNDHKKILSHIFFSGKCLIENIDHLFNIWEEVIFEYDFKSHLDYKQKKITNILAELGHLPFRAKQPNGFPDTASEWLSQEYLVRRIALINNPVQIGLYKNLTPFIDIIKNNQWVVNISAKYLE